MYVCMCICMYDVCMYVCKNKSFLEQVCSPPKEALTAITISGIKETSISQ